ncbi:sugar transferase [Halovivax limisalsi]|uniref:sugar transferase n=1 Tax=Halovivax limisalsi TaxID=1453760 RepID=UPI001FFDC88C|nr:sugar transferase [Halovivax limisalsi]
MLRRLASRVRSAGAAASAVGRGAETPTPSRALVVGTDAGLIETVADDLPVEPVGFVSPRLDDPASRSAGRETADPDVESNRVGVGPSERIARRSVLPLDADGALIRTPTDGVVAIAGIDRLGGLTRLRQLIRRESVDTLALAFDEADRGEFFGVLAVAADCGVAVLAHESNADGVLTLDGPGSLVTVEHRPWPWYSRLAKRLFDVLFAGAALLATAPLLCLIAAAIKLDSPGPVLYSQTRTAAFGDRFTVYKFRSMVADAEAERGATLSGEDAGEEDPRVTRVGRVLRTTHLDELPQLVSVLRGDMSVVGPRPERPVFDAEIAASGHPWQKRWLVKPGLTGLAQTRGVTSVDAERKLALDLEYATSRTFWLDVRLVLAQFRAIVRDVGNLVHSG